MDSGRRLHTLAISESGFIFDPNTGHTFTVNETGLEIIRHLKESKTLEEIVAAIAADYEAENELIYKDVVQFLGQLQNQHLIDEN
jgi:PqqD family protein of HPr-rel-A system